MDNKEQARVKAEKKCLELAWDGDSVKIVEYKGYFSAIEASCDIYYNFPFTDLKDGDACAVHNGAESHEFAYYFNSRFWGRYR